MYLEASKRANWQHCEWIGEGFCFVFIFLTLYALCISFPGKISFRPQLTNHLESLIQREDIWELWFLCYHLYSFWIPIWDFVALCVCLNGNKMSINLLKRTFNTFESKSLCPTALKYGGARSRCARSVTAIECNINPVTSLFWGLDESQMDLRLLGRITNVAKV